MLSSFEEIFSVDVSLNKPKPAKLGVWALGVWRPHSRPYCSTQKPNVGLLLFPDPTVVLLLLLLQQQQQEAPNVLHLYARESAAAQARTRTRAETKRPEHASAGE